MKNRGLFRLRLIFVAFLLLMTFFTGPYRAIAASPSGGPVFGSDPQTNSGESLTNQIIIKYRASANATDLNGQIKTEKISALSTAAGETLTYKRAMSGNAHVLKLTSRKSPAAAEAIARKLAALPDAEYAEPDYVMRPMLVPNDPSYTAQ